MTKHALALQDAAENLKAVTERYVKGHKGYGPSSVKLAYEKFQRRYDELIVPLLEVQAKMQALAKEHVKRNGPVIGDLSVLGYPKGYAIVPKDPEPDADKCEGCDEYSCICYTR